VASITIRDLDDSTKEGLRVRAERHQHSMEEEARSILCAAINEDTGSMVNLAEAIHRRFRPLRGVELDIPKRHSTRAPPAHRL
jgi:plasmid stability protein